MSDPIITVVICTFNRADLLGNVLRTLAAQTLSRELYEIIVVDNNSTDHTKSVVEQFEHLNVRYCLEKRQGVSNARNRGLKEAKAPYIGYTDDDCEIPPKWLSTATEIISKFQPAIFGGPHDAFYVTKKPRWFKDDYESRGYGLVARPLAANENLIGCNFFIQKATVESLGGFRTDLGMAGKKVAYGEEAAIQMLIRKTDSNSMIFYDPRLLVYHLVRPEQMKFHWIVRKFFAKGRYVHNRNQALGVQSAARLPMMLEAARTMSAMVLDIASAMFIRDRKKYKYIQNYFYERSTRYIGRLGSIYEQYQSSHRKVSNLAAAESD